MSTDFSSLMQTQSGEERVKSVNGRCSLVQEGMMRSQLSKYRNMEHPRLRSCAATTANTFVKTVGGCRNAEGKDPELVVVSALTEAKKFVVSQVDVDMEVRIFHVESCEPDSPEKGGNNQCEMNVQNFVLQMKVLRIQTLSIGRSPPPFFGMRNMESRNPSQ